MDDIKARLDKIADTFQIIYTTNDNAIVFPSIIKLHLMPIITV